MSKHIPRLYIPSPLGSAATLTLEEAQAHYLSRVMRASIGATVHLFNGQDGEWQGEITELGKKHCAVRINHQLRPQEAEPDLWLCFAPVKNARAEFVVEKATELGVSALQPVFTQHTVVNRVNEEKLRAHALEAAEQCNRLSVPELFPALPLMKMLEQWNPSRTLLFCDETGGGKPIPSLTNNPSLITNNPSAILIGPEGGFAKEEIAFLRQLPYVTPVSLGKRILRADTAAIAALALWQAATGN